MVEFYNHYVCCNVVINKYVLYAVLMSLKVVVR